MKRTLLLIALFTLSACSSVMAPDERMQPAGHVDVAPPKASQAELDIPPVVQQAPIIAAPEPAEPLQTFTVVATDLPADELLFALARDARLNLDIDPAIEGRVSINAIDQTLPQILKRISRQVSLRYYIDGPNLVVERNRPFTRIYRIDYLNMSRTTTTDVGIDTSLAAAEEGASGDSSAVVTSESNNNFWETLEANVELLATEGGIEGVVISNRESGTVSVYTTASAHENIQRFIDAVLLSARRQVLIEATVVEVTLSDDFQAGVDWARIATGEGWSLSQQVLGTAGAPGAPTLGNTPITSATYFNTDSERDISAAIQALDTFGDVSVMSSPKIMALNNQTSVLKVADNRVYFEIDVTTNITDAGTTESIDTTAKTVPVGFVMNVTPFVTGNDEVILNIRPTITRILGFVSDPNPTLAAAGVESLVPEVQVREIESVLRVASGNTAVIGGLMQDSIDSLNQGLPGLHDAKGIGLLFGNKRRDSQKTELVIFLRPRVIDNASLDTNLQDFKKFLRPEIFSTE